MAYVKLQTSVMDHPKIYPLSDKCFRLWIWGLCYCQEFLTDGFIPADVIPPRLKRAAPELVTRGQWVTDWDGYQVRDYLQWNDSKAAVEQKRIDAKARMGRVRANAPPNSSANTSRAVPNESEYVTAVPEEQTDVFAQRAGRLLQELYPEWYRKYRHGAQLRLIANSLDYANALSIVTTWDDARIEKLARIVLTTDDEFVSKTDRSFRIFALKSSWADDRLRQQEAQAS